jgi:hypothetical protein
LSDTDVSWQGGAAVLPFPPRPVDQVGFDRRELMEILRLYGRMVAAGEWRDYAIDMLREKAIFSVFRRSSEVPLYRIEKRPADARRQGAYAVVAPGGFVLKRGHSLASVLRVLEPKPVALV